MDATDSVLIEAWELALRDSTHEVDAKLETLLPPLLDAGYIEADEHTWRFTTKGVARAEALIADSID